MGVVELSVIGWPEWKIIKILWVIVIPQCLWLHCLTYVTHISACARTHTHVRTHTRARTRAHARTHLSWCQGNTLHCWQLMRGERPWKEILIKTGNEPSAVLYSIEYCVLCIIHGGGTTDVLKGRQSLKSTPLLQGSPVTPQHTSSPTRLQWSNKISALLSSISRAFKSSHALYCTIPSQIPCTVQYVCHGK